MDVPTEDSYFPEQEVEQVIFVEEAEVEVWDNNENEPPDSDVESPLDSEDGIRLRTRRRAMKARSEEWKRNKLVAAVSRGTEHVNNRGRTIAAKSPEYIDCKCKYKCKDHVSEDQQRVLFTEYRQMNRTEQRLHLAKLLCESTPHRRTVLQDNLKVARKVSIQYQLPVSGENDFQYHRVCMPFFCKTFAISQKVPLNIIRNTSPKTGSFSAVHRNRGRRPSNATSHVKIRGVKAFLNSIPKLPSHYTRKDTMALYFEPQLNRQKLYTLYKEQKGDESVSMYVFSAVFQEMDPPLRFFHPRKDQCVVCNNEDSVYDVPDPYTPPLTVRESHILRKDLIYEMKSTDKAMALADPAHVVYGSFDLEATLMLPRSEDSLLYYSRKLNMYNFTIWDSMGNGTCNYWTEINGGKGSNEIGTCLMDYLRSLPDTVRHVILYSDTCSGQNRNQFITACLFFAVNSSDNSKQLQTVEHKLMETGHSNMECDSMHATIEKAKENLKIYSSHEYDIVFRTARKHPCPYIVKEYSFSDFVDVKSLAKTYIRNRTKDRDGETVNWLRIKWFKYEKGSPYVYFKYNVEDQNFKELDISKSPDLPEFLPPELLTRAYSEQLPLSIAKKRDLHTLLQKGAIPTRYSHFYTSLPADRRVKDIAPWVTDELQDVEIVTVGMDD